MEQASFDLFGERQVLSVSELVNDLRFTLETNFRNLWVKGEVSNLKRYPSGHWYFTLKDQAAQVSAVCFRLQAQSMRFVPEDGMDVIVRGSVSVYPTRGQLQLIVETIEPLGRGALQVAFEQLKSRLNSEGLFDPAHKKKLPLLPSKIGIVTSPKGAAIQDVLRVLKRLNPSLNVLIFPCKVQGPGAAPEIASGIASLDRRKDVDVIIVGRGGGSLEDLWAFNEEVVARAIFKARKPVISAVGHEIDFTIADFVADIRAATPSAAAEIVSSARMQLSQTVSGLFHRSRQAMRLFLNLRRQQLQQLAGSRAFVDAESKLKLFSQRLDELYARLAAVMPLLVGPRRRLCEELREDLSFRICRFLDGRRQSLETRDRQLTAYSPLAVLERGYAIVTEESGKVVREPGQVKDGEIVDIRVAKGSFAARKEDRGISGF